MFNKFALSMIYGRAFQPMMDADGGAGAGSGAGEAGTAGAGEGGAGEGGNGDDDKNKGGGDGDDDKVTFDEKQQAHFDKVLAQKIAAERTKAEKAAAKAAAEAEARAKMTAEEKAEADRKDREKKVAEREAAANNRIINLELKSAASAAGVPMKKLERFLKVVNREEIEVDENGDVDQTKVSAAIKEVLDDMPEFKGSDQQQGPGGDFSGNGGGVKFTQAQIAAMTPEEVSKHWVEIHKGLSGN